MLTKVHLIKAMVFPVVMYRRENWTIKKAECWRIDAFELWCWRRLLRVSWTARRSNQSILKEISPSCSLEGLMLKLKLQYFGHLIWRADSFEKTLMLEKIEGGRRRGWQRMRWLDGITDSMDMRLVNSGSWWWSMGSQSQTRLSDWTEESKRRKEANEEEEEEEGRERRKERKGGRQRGTVEKKEKERTKFWEQDTKPRTSSMVLGEF